MDAIRLIPKLTKTDASEDAAYYDNCGADELFFLDADSFSGAEEDVKTVKAISRSADLPLNVCMKVKRFEDIKKMIYAGARRVIVRGEDDSLAAVKEASERFGAERIFLAMEAGESEAALARAKKAVEEEGFGGVVLTGDFADPACVQAADYLSVKLEKPVWICAAARDTAAIANLLKMSMASGILLTEPGRRDMMELKQALKRERLPVNTFESRIPFDAFRLNSDGMIPVVTQDAKTGQVLMLAYMTKEAFEKTIETGKMTYYSRSRKELWTKGETSGHFQYVKSLSLDCDNDTILAKVSQVGAACHTGSYSCFFQELLRKESDDHNPLKVFEEVFATILDRKEHPKEGSYTNYLFEKGIDKILKKVGEEATEIVIAAKNPDSDELKYEICDFLYHMMVLMAERDVTWKEITDELAERH